MKLGKYCVSLLDFASIFTVGLAVMLLWRWFVVRAFDVQEIGYWLSCGLVMFIHVIPNYHFKLSDMASNESEALANAGFRAFLNTIVAPLCVILVGYAISRML